MQIIVLLFLLSSFAAAAQSDSLLNRFPVDSASYASFDGTKIYYEVRGQGQAVLLVHGFISNSSSWKRTALYRDLLNSGYRVILLDMRGNGKSGKPHDSTAYHNDAEAKDIMQLMTRLKAARYAAIGYSRGSIIVARLLVLDKRVQKAVLGGMGADFTNPEWPRRRLMYRALMGDSIPEMKGVVDYVQKQKLDQLALAYLQQAQPSTPKEKLAAVAQPVLVISGDKDADNGSAAQLAKLFPHATLAVTPGDHNSASTTPEFSAEIIRFLRANRW